MVGVVKIETKYITAPQTGVLKAIEERYVSACTAQFGIINPTGYDIKKQHEQILQFLIGSNAS